MNCDFFCIVPLLNPSIPQLDFSVTPTKNCTSSLYATSTEPGKCVKCVCQCMRQCFKKQPTVGQQVKTKLFDCLHRFALLKSTNDTLKIMANKKLLKLKM